MRNNRSSIWNDERETALRTMWDQGLSASVIAATLRCFPHCVDGGRSAVIGKAHRMRLRDRTPPRPKGNRTRNRKPRPSTIAYQPKARKLPPPLPASPLPPPDVTDVARVSLLELESHHCRWPVGEPTTGFCGCTAFEGLPYCEAHARRAYRPTEIRTPSAARVVAGKRWAALQRERKGMQGLPADIRTLEEVDA